MWVVGCGAPVGYGTHETRACGAREQRRVRRAWRVARAFALGRRRRAACVRSCGQAGGRRARIVPYRNRHGACARGDRSSSPLTHTTRSTTTCMQWSLQVKPDSVSSVLSFIWFMIFCVMSRVVRWGEAFRIYFARSFRFVYVNSVRLLIKSRVRTSEMQNVQVSVRTEFRRFVMSISSACLTS